MIRALLVNFLPDLLELAMYEKLPSTHSLEPNLETLARDPVAAIEAFGAEWAGWCAVSALDTLNALKNCHLYAARHRTEAWAQDILRFSREGGAGSPLRQA